MSLPIVIPMYLSIFMFVSVLLPIKNSLGLPGNPFGLPDIPFSLPEDRYCFSLTRYEVMCMLVGCLLLQILHFKMSKHV